MTSESPADDPDPASQITDDGLTRADVEAAFRVLETLRTRADDIAAHGIREALNDTHYALQLYADERPFCALATGRAQFDLTFAELVRGTPAAPYEAAGYDVKSIHWRWDGGLDVEFIDPDATGGTA